MNGLREGKLPGKTEAGQCEQPVLNLGNQAGDLDHPLAIRPPLAKQRIS